MIDIKLDWKKNETYPKPSKLKVFGTFICGGGSTMGYKLAGFVHLGGVEIDPKMSNVYTVNHSPKYIFTEDIRFFNKREDLPSELYDLDILDGSPPCTTFSMVGNREADWGKKRKYKEGQQVQTLDDLVFEFCYTVNKLRPKTAILENVPGIIAGKAKAYAIRIYDLLNKFGYDVQIFSLNSATMGVPQARERIFFIARRKDLLLPSLRLDFSAAIIPFGTIADKNCTTCQPKPLWPSIQKRLPFVEEGDPNLKFADAKYRNLKTYNAFFSTTLLYDDEVPGTLVSSGATIYYPEKRNLNNTEYRRMQGFPSDYDFCGYDVRYICGMSVPPLMIANIATEIRKQWFNS
jgi:DNA (cytosine-5)-methyltransferase 1